MDLKGRMQDGSLVAIVRLGEPLRPNARASQFAIQNGEPLVWHPDDKDGTLFLTALTHKEVRLLTPRQ